MDHTTIRPLRWWLTGALLLMAWLLAAGWTDALDDVSDVDAWVRFGVALAAMTCLAVVGRGLRRGERASREVAEKTSTRG
ncbi:hypothetical protein WCD74_28830 [Actinomycetospora sp. OC33-EN08]|uniref:Uncharacterized protein n=1 Tax=Actinomycetospora aurantiaca TaxID=3129233 RepID=A0ABU8MWU2_9PSEU